MVQVILLQWYMYHCCTTADGQRLDKEMKSLSVSAKLKLRGQKKTASFCRGSHVPVG